MGCVNVGWIVTLELSVRVVFPIWLVGFLIEPIERRNHWAP